jgi:AraC family transcriptional regulator
MAAADMAIPGAAAQRVAWAERMLAQTRLDRVSIHLFEPARETYPREISGQRDEFILGYWLSDSRRPKGRYRFGADDFRDIHRFNYTPAGQTWHGLIDDECEVGQSLYCKFDKDYFKDIVGLEADANPRDMNGSIAAPSPLLQQCLWFMLDELKNPGFAHEVSMESLSRVLLVEVGRAFREVRTETSLPSGALAPWQLDRIRMFLETTPVQDVKIAEIASLCGVSESHFRRVFKLSAGMPFTTYVEKVRLERAKAMLADPKLPLKVVAHRLGFRHPSAFSNAFRKATGITPRAFRQMSLA